MTEEKQIIPKVVKVIQADKVVINRGSANGVKVGHRFLVYAIGEELFDPDSGLSLGKIELVRGRGEVTHVQEHLSTLKSIEKIKLPSKRRKIRDPYSIFGQHIEEDVEDTYEDIPFDDASVGDCAKPI